MVSVERCRYETLVEAASVAIDIYLKALQELKKNPAGSRSSFIRSIPC